ncbi:MAG: co-chaperone GroES [Anaerolineae bacterium]|nr:co-chaperone GroES [Anaerolineae bacterium]
MAANLKPLADRVVVEPLDEETMTATGVYLPDTAQERPMKGKIIAAGPGRLDEKGKRVALEVKVGDTVLYAKYAGTEVKVGDKDLLVLKETDVLAIIE